MDIMDVEPGNFLNMYGGRKSHIISNIILEDVGNVKDIPFVKSHCGLVGIDNEVSTRPWREICQTCHKITKKGEIKLWNG